MTYEQKVEELKGPSWEEFVIKILEIEKEYLNKFNGNGWVFLKNRKHNGNILELQVNTLTKEVLISDWKD
jgi:hypothetical protein